MDEWPPTKLLPSSLLPTRWFGTWLLPASIILLNDTWHRIKPRDYFQFRRFRPMTRGPESSLGPSHPQAPSIITTILQDLIEGGKANEEDKQGEERGTAVGEVATENGKPRNPKPANRTPRTEPPNPHTCTYIYIYIYSYVSIYIYTYK